MKSPFLELSGFYFFYFAFVGAFTPYWSVYLEHLSYSSVEIGILMSLLQVMRIFGPSVWGYLADVYHDKHLKIIQGACFLGLISYCGFFLDYHSFWFLFVIMSLLSFFWSASLPLVETITLAYLNLTNQAENYGRIRLWGSVGFIVTVAGFGYLFDYISIEWLVYLVLALKLGIFGFSYLIPEPPKIEHHEEHANDKLNILQILSTSTVFWLFVALFLMSVAHGPYYTFYSIYLVENHYDKSIVGLMWAIGVIFEVLVFMYMAQLIKKISLEKILIWSFLAGGIRFLLIGWEINYFWIVIFAQMLHALTFGTYHASAIALIHRYFKGKHQAKGQGLYVSLTFGLGGALGSLYSGFTWDYFGASITFTIASVACFLGWIILILNLKNK